MIEPLVVVNDVRGVIDGQFQGRIFGHVTRHPYHGIKPISGGLKLHSGAHTGNDVLHLEHSVNDARWIILAEIIDNIPPFSPVLVPVFPRILHRLIELPGNLLFAVP